MPAVVEPGQSMIGTVEPILEKHGLSRDWKILDFGCGVGRHTRDFRAAGYDVEGVDRPYPGLREELDALPDGGVGVHLSTEDGELPFPANHFDLVFSTSVFEHVQDYDGAISEIARVTKPGGWGLHVFPARWRPIESHIYVPFGARFQSKAWYRLWAQTGIRNQFQQDMTAAQTARNNAEYARTGLAYPTTKQVRLAFQKHFGHVAFAERDFIEATAEVSRVSRQAMKLRSVPGVGHAYRWTHNRVVTVQKVF